jgi:hypothetical protein
MICMCCTQLACVCGGGGGGRQTFSPSQIIATKKSAKSVQQETLMRHDEGKSAQNFEVFANQT